MSVEQVMSMLKEHEVKFIDLRFTDTKGKEQHVTIPAPVKKKRWMTSLKRARCSTAPLSAAGKALTNPTWS
ncbi:hypothetical protein SODG_003659 [Sodalis praecaptivus]